MQHVPQNLELMNVARNVRTFTNEICRHQEDHVINVDGVDTFAAIRIKK